jgi:hypothetical protein
MALAWNKLDSFEVSDSESKYITITMALKRNKSQQTYFRTTNSFIEGSDLLFFLWEGGGGDNEGGPTQKKIEKHSFMKTFRLRKE